MALFRFVAPALSEAWARCYEQRMPTPRPEFIRHVSEAPSTTWRYEQDSELMGIRQDLGRLAGLQRIGLNVQTLPPGRRTSFPHAEENEEEFVFVLRGAVEAWIDGKLYPMREGDLAAFPAGTGIAHSFLNNGADDAVLLVGGEATKDDNRIFYPLHPQRQRELPEAFQWTNVPARPLGAHDGVPDLQRR